MRDVRTSEPNSNKKIFLLLDDRSLDELLKTATPTIAKINTKMWEAVTPSQLLSNTLRYLAPGNTFE